MGFPNRARNPLCIHERTYHLDDTGFAGGTGQIERVSQFAERGGRLPIIATASVFQQYIPPQGLVEKFNKGVPVARWIE